MAEEDVSYTSVVFKNKKDPPVKGTSTKGEDIVYDEVMGQRQTAQQTADPNGLEAEKNSARLHRYQQMTACLGILCVILLLIIVALSVYFTLRQTTQTAENQNLTNINKNLLSTNENLRKDYDKLTTQFTNLTQNYTVLVNSTADLKAQNGQLKEQNQNLEAQKKNLTDQIQNMMTTSNELNVSRAQWAIDKYCPKNKNVRTCNSCQAGWLNFTSSCYAINDVKSTTDQKTWEGAREDCRGKNSDLAVIVNESEKKFVTDNSWNNANIQGYWIGLRAENGRWKWADGSFLSNSSWIQTPATNNSCVTSLQNRGWTPVSCDKKNAWICEKQALTV